jgi:preprotein translocase subunit SecD
MKTLSEVLREADPLGPLGNDARRPAQERRRARPTVAEHPGVVEAMPKRRAAMAAIGAFALIGMAAIVFNWPYPMDVVAAVRFEVRLAEENPAPDLREVVIPGTDRKIYVHPEAVIVNSDIARAQVAQGEGTSNFGVDLTFTAEGAAKMFRATQNHIGRPVAILVDGDVVVAPVVRAPISTSASINGSYSRADAERIVAGILGR